MSITRSQYEVVSKAVKYELGLMKTTRGYLLKALGNTFEAQGRWLGGVGGMLPGGGSKIEFRSPNVDIGALYDQIDNAIKRFEEGIATYEKNLAELSKEVE